MEVITPGKVILGGEHAVVYGTPAFASPTGDDLSVRGVWKEDPEKDFWEIEEERGTWSVARGKASSDADVHPFIERAVREGERLGLSLLQDQGEEGSLENIPGGKIILTSTLPAKSGLGSSSAVAATIVELISTIILRAHGKSLDQRPLVELERATSYIEKLIHRRPSGIDSTTSVYRKLVWFRNESPGPKFTKVVHGIHPKFKGAFHLLQSGVPEETTGEMVESTKRFLTRGSKSRKRLQKNERLVRELYAGLTEGDSKKVGKTISKLSSWMENIRVVGKRGQSVISACERAGMPAKVCGAGGRAKGSGIILVFSDGEQEKIEKVAKTMDCKLFEFQPPIHEKLESLRESKE